MGMGETCPLGKARAACSLKNPTLFCHQGVINREGKKMGVTVPLRGGLQTRNLGGAGDAIQLQACEFGQMAEEVYRPNLEGVVDVHPQVLQAVQPRNLAPQVFAGDVGACKGGSGRHVLCRGRLSFGRRPSWSRLLVTF